MQNHCYELAQKKNQTRYISHIYDFRLACHFSQSDWVKFHAHSEKYIKSVYVQVTQWFVCES